MELHGSPFFVIEFNQCLGGGKEVKVEASNVEDIKTGFSCSS